MPDNLFDYVLRRVIGLDVGVPFYTIRVIDLLDFKEPTQPNSAKAIIAGIGFGSITVPHYQVVLEGVDALEHVIAHISCEVLVRDFR